MFATLVDEDVISASTQKVSCLLECDCNSYPCKIPHPDLVGVGGQLNPVTAARFGAQCAEPHVPRVFLHDIGSKVRRQTLGLYHLKSYPCLPRIG